MNTFLSIGSALILLAGCTPAAPSNSTGETQTVSVATSFYPQTHFAQQVGGDLVDVQQVVASGADPHTYEPTPKQIRKVYDADLLIFNGAGQDAWAERMHEELEEGNVRVLIATELVERMAYEEDEHDDHHDDHDGHENEHEEEHHEEHGDHQEEHKDDHHEEDEHDHEHGEWDPHVWLDPLRAQQIVQAIASELAEIDPANAEQYNKNADAYASELQELDNDMHKGLSNCTLDAVVVSHDAFRYLAHRYGFHTLEIAGLSPSAEPSPARLAELSKIAKEEGIAHVFFETHVSPALSETLAQEIGAQTLVLHSIEALTKEERSAGKTYIDLMRQNLANLQIALQCS